MGNKGNPSRRSVLGFTLVEVLISTVLIAVFMTSLFFVNMQAMRILKRGKETSAARYMLQERVEQLRASNLLNATNLISTNWLKGSNFFGGNPVTAVGMRGYREKIEMHPCVLTNDAVVVDSTTFVRLSRTYDNGTVSIGTPETGNYGNFTATNASTLIHVTMQLVWVPFGTGKRELTNEVSTTIIAKGL